MKPESERRPTIATVVANTEAFQTIPDVLDASSPQRSVGCCAVPVVRVIMSTFNGAKFLPELLTSVSQQSGASVRWWIRDDGSSDPTQEILKDASSRTNMHISVGSNRGAVSSFLELLQSCPRDADFYALCDQDDVWLPNKLARAAQQLSVCEAGTPSLYCSRLVVVDGLLRRLRLSPLPRRPVGLQNALVENVAIGCTIVMNASALALLQQATPDPKRVGMHDAWAYLVVSACGTVVFDPVPSILYRQHGANVVGSRYGVRALQRRFGHVLDSRHRLAPIARDAELEHWYGQSMDVTRTELVRRHLTGTCAPSLRERWRYALTATVYRQSCIDDIAMRALITLGGYRMHREFGHVCRN